MAGHALVSLAACLVDSFLVLGPVISRITEWWTKRSIATALVIGSLKIRSYCENTRLLVMITLRRLPLRQAREQHLHLGLILLDVPEASRMTAS